MFDVLMLQERNLGSEANGDYIDKTRDPSHCGA